MLVPSKTYGLGLFDDFFDTPFSGRRDFSNTLMKTDVQEKDGNYILDMDLPGFAKEDIKAGGRLSDHPGGEEEPGEQRRGQQLYFPGALPRNVSEKLLCGRRGRAGRYPCRLPGWHSAAGIPEAAVQED